MDFGTWTRGDRLADGGIQMPWYAFSDEALAFVDVLSGSGWVQPFDWMT